MPTSTCLLPFARRHAAALQSRLPARRRSPGPVSPPRAPPQHRPGPAPRHSLDSPAPCPCSRCRVAVALRLPLCHREPARYRLLAPPLPFSPTPCAAPPPRCTRAFDSFLQNNNSIEPRGRRGCRGSPTPVAAAAPTSNDDEIIHDGHNMFDEMPARTDATEMYELRSSQLRQRPPPTVMRSCRTATTCWRNYLQGCLLHVLCERVCFGQMQQEPWMDVEYVSDRTDAAELYQPLYQPLSEVD